MIYESYVKFRGYLSTVANMDKQLRHIIKQNSLNGVVCSPHCHLIKQLNKIMITDYLSSIVIFDYPQHRELINIKYTNVSPILSVL